MNVHKERSLAIRQTMENIKRTVAGGADVRGIEQAKAELVQLASRKDLFSWADFPKPTGDELDSTLCVYREPDGQYALYVISSVRGMTFGPHDHGNSWAIVVAVEGEEIHHLYKRTDDGSSPGKATVERAGQIVVRPGHGISMLERGIHSIEAAGDEPLMCLHCYGQAFENQSDRREYNMEDGTYRYNNNVGAIEELPLHPKAR